MFHIMLVIPRKPFHFEYSPDSPYRQENREDYQHKVYMNGKDGRPIRHRESLENGLCRSPAGIFSGDMRMTTWCVGKKKNDPDFSGSFRASVLRATVNYLMIFASVDDCAKPVPPVMLNPSTELEPASISVTVALVPSPRMRVTWLSGSCTSKMPPLPAA